MVVPAAHEESEPLSPFEDPFGDRLVQNQGPAHVPRGSSVAEQTEQSEPPSAAGTGPGESAIEPPSGGVPSTRPLPLQTPEPGGAMPLDSTQQAPGADDPRVPAPLTTEPLLSQPGLPDPSRRDVAEPATPPSAKKKEHCWQFFAERDFCDEQSECRKGWGALEENPISFISLNISPPFKPDAEDPADAARYRQERLARNAQRKWFNRWNEALGMMDGEVLGLDDPNWNLEEAAAVGFTRPDALEGRWLRDSSDGTTAIIELVNGNTVELPWDKLSRGDRLFIAGREWVDRLGRKRATGRLKNYYKGDVYIETDDGETEKVPFLALNEDAMSFVAAHWFFPAECKLPDKLLRMPQDQRKLRDYTMITYTWTASGLCHKPLYFEQRALERYGHSTGPISQPILSGAHFFGSFFIWPYMMGIAPPHECQYALGFYRPGSCAPYMIPPIPLSPRGALLQAGTVVGLVYLLP
jgi:hypothetical protein